MTTMRALPAAVAGAVLLSGCASLSPEQAFTDVAANVEQRTGKQIEWDTGSDEDILVRNRIDHLLHRRLTASQTIQIALLKQ